MKRTLMMAAAAVATTTAMGIGAGGTASAGCGITLALYNPTSSSVTVDWRDSDVRVPMGWWSRLGSGSTVVGAGDTVRHSFTANLDCGWQRQYRLDVRQGSSSWFEYHGYTYDLEPTITLS